MPYDQCHLSLISDDIEPALHPCYNTFNLISPPTPFGHGDIVSSHANPEPRCDDSVAFLLVEFLKYGRATVAKVTINSTAGVIGNGVV